MVCFDYQHPRLFELRVCLYWWQVEMKVSLEDGSLRQIGNKYFGFVVLPEWENVANQM